MLDPLGCCSLSSQDSVISQIALESELKRRFYATELNGNYARTKQHPCIISEAYENLQVFGAWFLLHLIEIETKNL
jgi:hypothetical protein